MDKSEAKIGLFGGSFDPVHNGHLELAQKALEQFSLDKIVFIPAFQSPSKTEDYFFSSQDRFEMLKLAASDNKNFSVCDFELNNEELSYTYKTIEYFKETYSNAKLFWLLGSDNWPGLPNWKNFDFLEKNLSFLIFKRGEIKLENCFQELDFHFIENFDYKISSTEIRKMLLDNKIGFLSNHLNDSVLGYLTNISTPSTHN